jgi:hypothetical protein
MDERKNWTQQQDNLRKLLASKAHFVAAMQLFLAQHAAVHTAGLSRADWSLADEVLTGLTDEQLRWIPKPGQNSIVWLLWHITRIEDMTINTLTMEQPQVLDADWAARLNVPFRNCGASMEADEVAAFSAQIAPGALLDYRAAVGCRTRESVPALSAEQVKMAVPTATVQKLVDEGSISAKGHWLFEYYLKRSKGFFLTRTATSHNFIHLNEAGRVRAKFFK